MAKAYRGVLKARINKLYGGDVTCAKVKKLKAKPFFGLDYKTELLYGSIYLLMWLVI